jgi:hypothetical protein
VIQYDRSDPSAADWFDLSLREDGVWLRKSADAAAGTGTDMSERDMQQLIEWLVS